MRRWWLAPLLGSLLVLGCSTHEDPLPPVPPAPEDLSTWAVPELVPPPPPIDPPPAVTSPPPPVPTEQVVDFVAGMAYTVKVPLGMPLDILLQPGEQIRNVVGGDRTPVEATQAAQPTPASPWDVKEGAEGQGTTLRSHLFVSATTPGLTMGLIVTTTKRTYYLVCKSVGKSPIRTVRWRYPADPAPVVVREPGLLPDPLVSKQWHVGYVLTSQQAQPPDWLPRHILDDGRKMYVVFPEITLFETAPMVRMIGPNGPSLVNARQYLNVLIVDQLAPRLELRVGVGEQAEVVTIARGALQTIACPGDGSCPVWPKAAQTLAQKAPRGEQP